MKVLGAGIIILLVLSITACGSKQTKTQEEEQLNVTAPEVPAPVVEQPVAENEVIVPSLPKAAERASELEVYFDFDKSDIKPEFRAMIEQHANYLVENPQVKVSIEGHCDERGTREYNMALGERRAYAVVKMLSMLGVMKSQMSSVSYGEDRPARSGHDESAWKWNRRGVFVYNE